MRLNRIGFMTVIFLAAAAMASAQGPPHGGDHFRGGPPHGDPEMGPPPPPPHGGGRGRGPHPPPPPEMEELFQQVMIARLSKELDFSDEQTVLLVRKFIEHREEMHERRKEFHELTRELRRIVEDDPNSEEIEHILGRLLELEEQQALERRALFEEMREGLDREQQARLYIFIQRFEEEMRRLIHRARARIHGGNGAPRGGREGRPMQGRRGNWHDDGPREFRGSDEHRPPPHHNGDGPPPPPPPPPFE